ncbi:MAG: hypothetical protein ACI8ZN_001892 [Bacteroidia bacterium]|jgi:hypothetical protein
MKRLKVKSLVGLIGLLIFGMGCGDNIVPDNSNPNGTTTKAKLNALQAKLAPQTQRFSIDATKYQYFTTQYGTQFSFAPNLFVDGSGSAVSGSVDIEILELKTVSDMFLSGVTTVSGNSLLSSGGMFKIEASQNGTPLQLKSNGSFDVMIANEGLFDPSMQLFVGQETGDEENVVVWVEADQKQGWVMGDSTQGGGRDTARYYLNVKFLSWCNLDKYYSGGIDLTTIDVTLPDDYTNVNANVFLFIENDNASVRLFGDKTKETFNTGSYKIPVGFNIKIVAVGQLDGKLYYKIVPTTVVVDHEEIISTMDEITEADLETVLQNL